MDLALENASAALGSLNLSPNVTLGNVLDISALKGPLQQLQGLPGHVDTAQLNWTAVALSPAFILLLTTAVVVLLGLYIAVFSPPSGLVAGVPILGTAEDTSYEGPIREGDRLYGDSVYQIRLPSMPHVFFPRKAIKELYSTTEALFSEHTSEILLGKFTYQGEPNPELKDGIRLMSANLDVVIRSFQMEMEHAFQECFGECDEWTTVEQLWPTTFRMAAILSSRPFLGVQLSRNNEWIQSVLAFAMSLSEAVGSSRMFSRTFRKFFEQYMPYVKALVTARDHCEEMMTPVIEDHIRRWEQNGGSSVSPRNAKTYEDGGELLDFIIPSYEKPNAKKLARDEITVILESMLNLSSGLSHVLFNIAKHQDTYADDLREEYLQVIAEDGKLTKNGMFKMRKMDSFMKETQRLNPPALMAMQRKVVAPQGMQLSVGPRIPKGTLVAVSADRVNMDPEYYPDPERFDGYRFLRMREKAGEEFKHQHVSTSENELNFSFGGRACPGRIFFASMEKAVLSHLLTHFDFRVKPGFEDQDSRWIDGIRVTTNPKAIMQLRKKAERK